MRASAILFDGPGQPLRMVTAEKPELQKGEAWVRITCAALCRSDLHTFMGRRTEPTPTILGHEIIGIVEESKCEAEEGSRVTWGIAASCGSCFFCLKGIPQKCVSLFKYGHTESAVKGPHSGGLATHILLRAGTPILPLPDDLPDDVAVLANCSTATAAAVVRAAEAESGETALVLGAGVLGVTAAAMLADVGCRVAVFDPSTESARRCLHFGATHSFSSLDVLHAQLAELTEGRGPDFCLELSGAKAAAELALTLPRIGGRTVWAGTTSPLGGLEVSPEVIVRKLLTLKGVHNYAPQDLALAVEFLTRTHRKWPFASLTAQTFPLSGAAEAFEAAERLPGARVLIRP